MAAIDRLWWYSTEPGDRDHMEGFYFVEGVVEADAAEIAGIKAALEAEHEWEVRITPLIERICTIDVMKEHIGNCLAVAHGVVMETPVCEADIPYILLADPNWTPSESDEDGDTD